MKLVELRFVMLWLLPLVQTAATLHSPRAAVLGALSIWLSLVLVDALVPPARRSPAAAAATAWHRWVLRLYVPLHLLLIACGFWAAARSSWLELLGLALAVGFITGAQGITVAHELGHSKLKLDRILAWVLMTSVAYSHFMVEHYRGHHPRAATLDDPASARYGESLWRFLPRTYIGSFASAWRLEAQRLAQRRRSWWHSPLLWTYMAKLALALVLSAGAAINNVAIKLLVFWLLQSLKATWLLETVNYIEHYGLSRRVQNGQREAFGAAHAWNADHFATNAALVNLQRHSDHHMHAWKPFPELDAQPADPAHVLPQLPTGYAGCIWLALWPPLWFALMHPRLARLNLPPELSPGPQSA
jgi:alkane 1-monooxygenase